MLSFYGAFLLLRSACLLIVSVVLDGGPSDLKVAQQERRRSREQARYEYKLLSTADGTQKMAKQLESKAQGCVSLTPRMSDLLVARAQELNLKCLVSLTDADHD